MLKFSFPYYPQFDSSDCGAACLRMIAKFYGRGVSQHNLREDISTSREGASLLGISEAAERIGFRTIGAKITFQTLKEDVILPCIAFWNQIHFVVIYKITRNKIYLADPSIGLISYSHSDFLKCWINSLSNEIDSGIVLAMHPTPAFYESDSVYTESPGKKLALVARELLFYLRPHRNLILLLVAGLFLASILQLVFPFLTQAIVDVGISSQNLSFIKMLLVGQLMLFVGMISNLFVQQLITLHLSTRINISAISSFLSKLFYLPLSFFEGRIIGDILKRIEDHYRVEQFLSITLLPFVFSVFTFLIFGVVLYVYSTLVFLLFMLFSCFYLFYVLLFLRKRKELDYKRFQQLSLNQGNVIQIVQGMTEIKLNNAETFKMWEWEKVQAKVFKANLASLKLSQYQDAGGQLINEIKNVLLLAFTAFSVVNGDMTIGMMVSVQFIIGQVDAQMHLFVGFIQRWQDARIAMERIGEVNAIKKEAPDNSGRSMFTVGKEPKAIQFENVSFSYGPNSEKVLDGINLTLPSGKLTAVVGPSGSGKTTLLKLLLKFYPPSEGSISLDGVNFDQVNISDWRRVCGVVMQDGFIFSDSIARNIALSEESVDFERLTDATKLACIHEFIDALPIGYNSMLGSGGIGLSQGQKQRLLIARALYKDPAFIMFDEATSSLDANNEKLIMKNMKQIFHGRTVMVIAHRLSTVKNADQIIVLDKGKIIESGNHEQLLQLKGSYYNLIQNQLFGGIIENVPGA